MLQYLRYAERLNLKMSQAASGRPAERLDSIAAAEPRCLVPEKPGLSTREMANMPGVSGGNFRRTRLRLRRKTSFWLYCNVFVTPPSRGMC